MKQISVILKSLSDETRLRIVNILRERELCVCDIEEILGIPQTKASRHLAVLKNAGLVRDRKHAQWVFHALNNLKDLKFLDELIYGTLRKLKLYAGDIKVLKSRVLTGACHTDEHEG